MTRASPIILCHPLSVAERAPSSITISFGKSFNMTCLGTVLSLHSYLTNFPSVLASRAPMGTAVMSGAAP